MQFSDTASKVKAKPGTMALIRRSVVFIFIAVLALCIASGIYCQEEASENIMTGAGSVQMSSRESDIATNSSQASAMKTLIGKFASFFG